MKKNYTHIVFLLDKSGSMLNAWSDTIAQLENLFQEQKKEDGELTVSFYTFNNYMTCGLNFVNVNSVNKLPATYASGSTSLYDSFCKSIDEVGGHLSEMKEKDRPSKVMFVLVTDGGENTSVKYGLEDCKSRLNEQKNKYDWSFLFIGADFDTKQLAQSFNLDPAFAMGYTKGTEENTSKALHGLVSNYRSSPNRVLRAVEAVGFSEQLK